MIVVLKYSVSVWPGYVDSGGELLNRMSLIDLAVNSKSLKKHDVLKEIRDKWVQPILDKGDAASPTEVGSLTLLRQLRHVLQNHITATTLSPGTFQHVEEMEGGFLSLVHNVTIKTVL